VITYKVQQGSLDWHKVRAGVITASNFDLRKRLKNGSWSAAAQNYAFRLAVERIAEEPLDDLQFMPWQATRGTALEPTARLLHETTTGYRVVEAGFATTNCGRFGASVDGFMPEIDGGAEYKCFLSPEKLRAILLDYDLSDVMDQIQGGMWVAEREIWHFGLYCPALTKAGCGFTVRTVHRDELYIDSMVKELEDLDQLVEDYRDQLLEA